MKKTIEAWKAFTQEPYDYNININNNIDINANTDTKSNTENTTLEGYNNNQNKVILNQNKQSYFYSYILACLSVCKPTLK